MASVIGGDPAWWLEQDDQMVATGIAVAEQLYK